MMRKRLPQEEEDLCGGLFADFGYICAGFSYFLAFSRALSTAFKSVIQV